MKHALLITTTLISLSSLTACEKNDHNTDPAALSGAYQACFQMADARWNKGTLVYTGSNFATNSIFYSGANCTGSITSTETKTGTFIVAETTLDGASKAIDYTYSDGTKFYDIYKLDGENLQTGDVNTTTDGTTPGKRPIILNSVVTYKKQQL